MVEAVIEDRTLVECEDSGMFDEYAVGGEDLEKGENRPPESRSLRMDCQRRN